MTQPAAPAYQERADLGGETTHPYARERDEGVSALRGLVWAVLFAVGIVSAVVVVIVGVVTVLT